ncbi:hypothetical protein ACULNC_07720 [Shigella flexneri]
MPKFDLQRLFAEEWRFAELFKNLWRLVVRNGSERQQADGDYSGDA